MIYMVWLTDKNGDPGPREYSILPGLIDPKQLAHTKASFVEKRLKLCASCPTHGCISHVGVLIGKDTWDIHCPVLFHDLVKPEWDVAKVAP